MSLDAHSWAGITADLRRYVARRVPPAEVDDLVQEVLLRVVTSLDTTRPVGAFAQTVARNAVIDRARKRTPTPPAEPEVAHAEDLTIEAQAEAQRLLLGVWLRFAVERLPEAHREAVHRVDVLGQPQAEVAEALGIPYSTLKSRVQRGRAKLREAFFQCCDAELDARGRVDTVRSRGDCPCCD